jgi:RNA polymerase sigma factor (sigma-70 family)
MLDHRNLLAGEATTTRLFLKLVRQWVRKFFRKPSQIEAVVQSAMIEMLGKLRAGNVPDPDRTFYWALNCATNAVRRELTKIHNHRADTYDSRVHGHVAAADPDATLDLRRDLERVEALLDVCNQNTRALLEAKVCGSTYRAIAAEFNLNQAAARMSVSRLRHQVADQLAAQAKRDLLRQQINRVVVARQRSTPRPDSSSSSSGMRS